VHLVGFYYKKIVAVPSDEIKCKFFPVHATKTQGGMEVYLHSF